MFFWIVKQYVDVDGLHDGPCGGPAKRNLKSWIQIPPGPFLSVRELRIRIERVFNNFRTNSAWLKVSKPSIIGPAGAPDVELLQPCIDG
jgi:hypothetical protein